MLANGLNEVLVGRREVLPNKSVQMGSIPSFRTLSPQLSELPCQPSGKLAGRRPPADRSHETDGWAAISSSSLKILESRREKLERRWRWLGSDLSSGSRCGSTIHDQLAVHEIIDFAFLALDPGRELIAKQERGLEHRIAPGPIGVHG